MMTIGRRSHAWFVHFAPLASLVVSIENTHLGTRTFVSVHAGLYCLKHVMRLDDKALSTIV